MRRGPLIIFLGLITLAAIAAAAIPRSDCVMCRAELRSWIVAARGRHLYLDIICPGQFAYLNHRVEFTEARLRTDYSVPRSPAHRNYLAKMNRGHHLHSLLAAPDNRLESAFLITLDQAACLQRDRLFAVPYALVTTNSNAAIRHALRDCGCPDVPKHVTSSVGLFGQFPGADVSLGPEIDPERWPDFGLIDGPEPMPEPASDALRANR